MVMVANKELLSPVVQVFIQFCGTRSFTRFFVRSFVRSFRCRTLGGPFYRYLGHSPICLLIRVCRLLVLPLVRLFAFLVYSVVPPFAQFSARLMGLNVFKQIN